MNNRKKALLAQIRDLLRGPVPRRTLFYLGGIYLLFENNIMKEINEVQAKAILHEAPDCKIFFICVNQKNPPESLTDELERYKWCQEHPVETEIPGFIQARLNPPQDQVIEVSDIATGKEFINLITNAVKEF